MPFKGQSRKSSRTDRSKSWAHHECPPLPHIEYNIYSYSNDDTRRACWQKYGSAAQADSAIAQAETLFSSGQYKKIEVKQRYFDLKTRRNIDHTWRVFGEDARTRSFDSWNIVIVSLVTALTFMLTYIVASI